MNTQHKVGCTDLGCPGCYATNPRPNPPQSACPQCGGLHVGSTGCPYAETVCDVCHKTLLQHPGYHFCEGGKTEHNPQPPSVTEPEECECRSDVRFQVLGHARTCPLYNAAQPEPRVPSPSGMAPPVSSDVAPDREGTGALQDVIAKAEPVAPPTAEAITTKLEELRTSYESGNLEWAEAIHLYNVWRRALEQSAPLPIVKQLECIQAEWSCREVDFEHECVTLPFHVAESLDKLLGISGVVQGEQAIQPTPGDFLHALYCVYRGCKRCQELMERYPAESPAQSKEPR